MFRKTLIAIAAAGTLALGMGSLTSSANANVTITIGGGYNHGWNNGRHCQIQRVKVRHHHRWVWRKIRSCHFHGRPMHHFPMHHGMNFGHHGHWNNW
jgi:hypothetical protein